LGLDLDFAGFSTWCIPNSAPDHSNGYTVEFLDDSDNILQSETFPSWGDDKSTWWPLIYPKTELWIKNKKVKLHHDPWDHSAFWSYYECILREDYKEIDPEDVVVDVGANLGFFTLHAIKKGAAKCYSIEPISKTFDYLVKNVEGLPVVPINLGIGSSERTDYFVGGEVTSISRLSDYDSTVEKGWFGKKTEKIEVKLKPFNQILNENGIGFIDYLKVDCEGGELDVFNTIDPDYLRYRVKKIAGEIHIGIIGLDQYTKIKDQLIEAGFDYSDDYDGIRDLVVFFAKKKPKIKLIHILNDVNGEREKVSIEHMKKLSKYGIEYTQNIAPLYEEIPPASTCARPDQISSTSGHYLLSPRHYGCYLGHKGAICDSGEDFDGLVVAECDTILTVSPREMAEKIYQVYFENIKNDLVWTSFGKQVLGYHHEKVSDDIYWSNRIVEIHFYLTSKPKLGILRDGFHNKKWDAADLWYDGLLGGLKRGIMAKPYALQQKGISYIDGWVKDGYYGFDHNLLYNPFRNDDDISVIIQSCDKYSHLWEGWYLSFSRYWNWNLNWPVYFCNEEMDLPFNDPRIIQIKSPKSENGDGFSTRLLDVLNKIDTRYVLYIQEDMWLTNKLDFRIFKEGLYKMRYHDWNCLRIHEKIWSSIQLEKSHYLIDDQRVLRVKPTSEWLLTHNAGIWNREFLIESILPNESAWTNEKEGTVRISKKYTDPKIYHLDERWYYQPGASQNGNINTHMKEYAWYLKMNSDLRKIMDV
jgi:FkbM family methyltransferase